MKICIATSEDAKPISDLILQSAALFTVDPNGKGAEGFLKSVAPEAIAGYIADRNFIYLVAEINGEFAGAVAIRDCDHLYHLFVPPRFQRQGIAKALWEQAKEKAIAAGNTQEFTVNSTPGAVPVYERFGFMITGPQEEKHGIAFVPMKLTL